MRPVTLAQIRSTAGVGAARRPLRPALLITTLAVAASATLAGCGHGGSNAARRTEQQLGRVPIPSAAVAAPTATGDPGHPALVAMGVPVRVTLPSGTATVTSLGPATDPPVGGVKPNSVVKGVITLTVTAQTGSLTLAAADLACRDENGKTIALTPTGPASATAHPGQPATVRLTGTFHSGSAQINWRTAGHVVAIWDFTVEID